MADLLVTGTDTTVGKTLVAAALLLELRSRGIAAVGFKPVESGLDEDEGAPADSELLARASGVDEPAARPLLRLGEPLAPAVAAERAGRELEPAAVHARVDALRVAGYRVVVEGAGGLMVPLAWGFTALDLAAEAGLSVVIVARAGLGTLNHVVLTAEALHAREVPIAGVVLNGRRDPPDLAERTNPAALARLLPGVRVVVTPRLEAAGLEAAVRLQPLLAGLL
jgi:dethiobiotin synthetase